MLIRETIMTECWCPVCHKGQMQQLWQKSFEEKKELRDYIGEQITCAHCGTVNTLRDVLRVFPTEFHSFSLLEGKHQSNDEFWKFITDSEPIKDGE